jgi:uncharacterized membrane protein
MKKLLSKLNKNWFIVGIIIILIGVDISIHIPIIDIKSSYFGAIISFIGIIATFIVIGNYAQVHNIKEEYNNYQKTTDKKIEQLEQLASKAAAAAAVAAKDFANFKCNMNNREIRATINYANNYKDTNMAVAFNYYLQALRLCLNNMSEGGAQTISEAEPDGLAAIIMFRIEELINFWKDGWEHPTTKEKMFLKDLISPPLTTCSDPYIVPILLESQSITLHKMYEKIKDRFQKIMQK